MNCPARFHMSTHPAIHRKENTRQGFTLIEILVVLGIAAVVTAITVGGFREMTQGNKRTSCQSNLAQIYQACRLYANDEGGRFPYYNFSTPNDCNTTAQGVGLWVLYTFPNSGYTSPATDKPIERYIRSDKVLHCPSHFTHRTLFTSGSTLYDTEYLSYQTCDGGVPTYASVRTTTTTDNTKPWQRQLMHFNGTSFVTRLPEDKTVVTWCINHRNPRDIDNVLFYDGSVQLLPKSQANPDDTAPTIATMPSLTDWRRKPKDPQ